MILAEAISWRSYPKGSKLGTVAVRFPSGIIIHEITIHSSGRRCWAVPPARPWLRDGDNELVRDKAGKVQFDHRLIDFVDQDCRRRWSETVIAAVRVAYPDLLPFPEDALETLS